MKKLIGASLFLFCGLIYAASGAAAPYTTPLDSLLLPNTPLRTLQMGNQKPVYVQISPKPHAQVLAYYLKLLQQPDWQLDFPNLNEAEIWLKALKKSKQPEVFMLNLSHKKPKFNAYLTIGRLADTSTPQAQTIITIYTTPQPFGRSGR
jgi:hypothetical protein